MVETLILGIQELVGDIMMATSIFTVSMGEVFLGTSGWQVA